MLENSSAIRPSSEGRQPRVRSGSDGRSFRVRSRSTNDPRYLPKQPNPRALGGKDAVNDLAMLQVRRCAELQAMCEQARAAQLNGQPVDMLALVRLEGIAARSLRLLGLKVEPAKAPPRFLEMRRQRWAAQEKQQAKAVQTAREAAQNNTPMEQPPDGTAE